jgi:hypothetical protein
MYNPITFLILYDDLTKILKLGVSRIQHTAKFTRVDGTLSMIFTKRLLCSVIVYCIDWAKCWLVL